jgi:hypothetical protein
MGSTSGSSTPRVLAAGGLLALGGAASLGGLGALLIGAALQSASVGDEGSFYAGGAVALGVGLALIAAGVGYLKEHPRPNVTQTVIGALAARFASTEATPTSRSGEACSTRAPSWRGEGGARSYPVGPSIPLFTNRF